MEDADGNGIVDSGESNPAPVSSQSISGTVYAEDGVTPFNTPVLVRIYRGTSCGELELAAAVLSDSTDGTYTASGLEPGTYYIQADTEGTDGMEMWYSQSGDADDCASADPVSAPSEPAIDNIDFMIATLFPLEGTVYQDDGVTPVSERVLISVFSGGACNGSPIKTVTTNTASGEYRIKGLGSGTYHLYASATESDYSAEWYTDGGNGYECEDAEPVTYNNSVSSGGNDFLLDHGYHLSGNTFENDGTTAITGGRLYVNVYPDDGCSARVIARSFIDPSTGSYTTPALQPGTYYLLVKDLDSTYFREWWSGSGNGFTCEQADAIEIIDADGSGLDVSLDTATPGASVFGTITLIDGVTPVPEPMQVTVYRDDESCGDSFVSIVSTDSDGRYRIDNLDPGSYRLHAYHSDSEQRGEWWSSTNPGSLRLRERRADIS